MAEIICKCGHTNPEGTQICLNCGRPLTEEMKNQKLMDMRYEGSARRSQTYNKSVIDKVWNFFSSVRVGVTIIVILLVAAAIGTILPQVIYVPVTGEAEIAAYYERVYGTFGKIYNMLGLSDLYSSWWFQILVGMLGISIIVASIDRVVPLYKSLKNQRVRRHNSFMKRQRIFGEGDSLFTPSESLEKSAEKLKELRYNVRVENNAVLGEKGRYSRWGPYINHAGLIIFLIGVMIRSLPGFYVDDHLWLREGETRAIPGAPGYFLKSDDFILETYDQEKSNEVFGKAIEKNGTIASNYQTNVTLYQSPEDALPGQTDNLKVVKKDDIQVNEPLKFDGYAVYQMDFRLNEFKTMTFDLENKATSDSLGTFTIDIINPETEYDLGNGSKVEVVQVYPDFGGFENGVPQLRSPLPNNPAFLVRMFTPETPEGETSFVAIKQNIEPLGENKYKLAFKGVETRDVSGLAIRKDKTLWLLGLGGLIFMIGVIQGAYFNHRRIWIHQTENGKLAVAAHTNKNWLAITKELEQVREAGGLPPVEDQQDIEILKQKEEAEKKI
ncbi:cytochrome c biogenesis protein ResB [Paenisporosarcina cavernae]|uniref:Cytochrome C biogenesis protein n=1 Tax=Paenisporosarcina cavernae TaxID=2320858 RepID=A0A385YRX9_9BACL|nr:cytochrome c biogenesis protein ResB [Paenisporosarcina cavernae]AYC29356.1 cytochrome C biogenesis protein [Paenisporosarcina cavernae]